ncbi:hypothetical protein ScPMuIL_018763 [Solemya velum]
MSTRCVFFWVQTSKGHGVTLEIRTSRTRPGGAITCTYCSWCVSVSLSFPGSCGDGCVRRASGGGRDDRVRCCQTRLLQPGSQSRSDRPARTEDFRNQNRK